MTDIPEIRAAFLESWERNGNDPAKGGAVFNRALIKYRTDAQKEQIEIDARVADSVASTAIAWDSERAKTAERIAKIIRERK